jgi:type IV fimbrial biogenesis protein FimT
MGAKPERGAGAISKSGKIRGGGLTETRLAVMLGDMNRLHAPLLPRSAGFTLIELMVTVMIAVIVTAWAVPSFTHMIASGRLTAAANEVVLSLAKTRATAASLNTSTQWCGDSNNSDALGKACDTATSDGSGLGGAAIRLNGGVATLITTPVAGTGDVTLAHGAIQAIRFLPVGLGVDPENPTAGPYSGVLVDLCIPGDKDNHRVISMTTGSVISVATTSGSCS